MNPKWTPAHEAAWQRANVRPLRPDEADPTMVEVAERIDGPAANERERRSETMVFSKDSSPICVTSHPVIRPQPQWPEHFADGSVAGQKVVRYRLIRPGAKAPVYSTPGSSGMDGFASRFQRPSENGRHANTEPTTYIRLGPLERVVAHCGFAAEIPPGLELQVRPRSGRARDAGLVVVFGTIDSDYRGEIGAVLVNLGNDPVDLAEGDRVCQFVLAPVVRAEMVLADELSETQRGTGGFGHSGMR